VTLAKFNTTTNAFRRCDHCSEPYDICSDKINYHNGYHCIPGCNIKDYGCAQTNKYYTCDHVTFKCYVHSKASIRYFCGDCEYIFCEDCLQNDMITKTLLDHYKCKICDALVCCNDHPYGSYIPLHTFCTDCYKVYRTSQVLSDDVQAHYKKI
jgi:hypothetical protein